MHHPNVRVACILDEFSFRAFSYEATLTQLTPDSWERQLDEIAPHLLLVESAWRGADDSWRHHMTGPGAPSDPLRQLTEACRARGIPTLFWNKEDPPNYDLFIATARLFDQVMTVDEAILPRYVADLGHDRVTVLPFAAQPRIHNPLLPPEGRDHGVAFAGNYYVEKHPHRKVQVMQIIEPARSFGLHIYARFTAKAYRWPAPLDRHVVGSLDYAQTLEAYRRYQVFLNVNSVTGSQTMCARRIFELLACGTTILSGTSPAIDNLLGPGLVAQSEDPDLSSERLQALLGDGEHRSRTAARGVRRVLDGHTYRDRFARILELAGGVPGAEDDEGIAAVIPVGHGSSADRLLLEMSGQERRPAEVVLVGSEDGIRDAAGTAARLGLPQPIPVTGEPDPDGVLLGANAARAPLVALLDRDATYGPGFLSDQANAFTYTDAIASGKTAHWRIDARRGTAELKNEAEEHRRGTRVAAGSVVIRREMLDRERPANADDLEARLLAQRAVVGTSRYDFARRSGPGETTRPTLTTEEVAPLRGLTDA